MLSLASLSATADCLASNCASWVQLDANQSADRANMKYKYRIKPIVLLESDWLHSANNMETVPYSFGTFWIRGYKILTKNKLDQSQNSDL